MHATKPHLVLLLAAALACGAVAQQAPSKKAPTAEGPKVTLDKGIELFGQEKYREALDLFGKVMFDPKAKAERSEAAY